MQNNYYLVITNYGGYEGCKIEEFKTEQEAINHLIDIDYGAKKEIHKCIKTELRLKEILNK